MGIPYNALAKYFPAKETRAVPTPKLRAYANPTLFMLEKFAIALSRPELLDRPVKLGELLDE